MPKKIKVTGKGVYHAGAEAEVGEVLELGDLSADALISEGMAEEIEPAGQNDPDSNENQNDGVKVPRKDGAQEGETEGAEEVEKITKALDAQYKRDELAERAKEVGVEFPYNAKKDEIVKAIIEQEKAEAVLKSE